MSGFEAAVSELRSTSKGFHRESDHLDELTHLATQPPPAVDDAALASALAHVVDSLAIAYKTVTKTTDSHGTKLRKAAESYGQSDADTHQMYDDLMGDIDTGN